MWSATDQSPSYFLFFIYLFPFKKSPINRGGGMALCAPPPPLATLAYVNSYDYQTLLTSTLAWQLCKLYTACYYDPATILHAIETLIAGRIMKFTFGINNTFKMFINSVRFIIRWTLHFIICFKSAPDLQTYNRMLSSTRIKLPMWHGALLRHHALMDILKVGPI